VYARDADGRVVSRKPIAITDDGRLVGYRTYTTLGPAEGGAALRAVLRAYVADVAAGCGLALADQGTVRRLLAEAWYDDDVVPWGDDEPTAAKAVAAAAPAAEERVDPPGGPARSSPG
jgi:hypothetical protein